jgi:hypothetical protein
VLEKYEGRINTVICAAIQDFCMLRKEAATRGSVKNTGEVTCQTAVAKCCHIPSLTFHLSQESV